jgi:hypothetical protein
LRSLRLNKFDPDGLRPAPEAVEKLPGRSFYGRIKSVIHHVANNAGKIVNNAANYQDFLNNFVVFCHVSLFLLGFSAIANRKMKLRNPFKKTRRSVAW